MKASLSVSLGKKKEMSVVFWHGDMLRLLLDDVCHRLHTGDTDMQVRGHGSGFGVLFMSKDHLRN